MLSNVDMKDFVIKNLNDIRIFAIQAFITRLIERKKHGDGVKQYRIHDKITNTDVISLDDFIAKIDPVSIVADYFYYANGMSGDRTHPFAVNLSNFNITLDKNSEEDGIYFNMFGGDAKNILLLMNYLADGDIDLPLKIFDIRLIGQK